MCDTEKNENIGNATIGIKKLDSGNAKFFMKNMLLSMTLCENGEEKTFDRVFLHRDFPHELLWQYISVIGEDNMEIGLIEDISHFDAENMGLLRTELERKYYMPCISSIENVKERYGFSYWNVTLADGRKISFTMRDTFRNIVHTSENSIVLNDVDGNRFIIENILSLSRKSYRKIEIYM